MVPYTRAKTHETLVNCGSPVAAQRACERAASPAPDFPLTLLLTSFVRCYSLRPGPYSLSSNPPRILSVSGYVPTNFDPFGHFQWPDKWKVRLGTASIQCRFIINLPSARIFNTWSAVESERMMSLQSSAETRQ